MYRNTRLKHFSKETMEDDYELPKYNQQIVRIVCCPGGNLYKVETGNVDDENFLVLMPKKFRRNIWVIRGDYLLVEPIEEGPKVKAEICKILSPEHIKEYKKANIWPERFAVRSYQYGYNRAINTKYIDSDSETDDLEPNMNRPLPSRSSEEDSEEDGDECSSSSGEY